jgi:hypothetical protein
MRLRRYRPTTPWPKTISGKSVNPTVTVLPPTPPERGGGPQRIHVVIELVLPTPRQHRIGGLVF